MTDTPKLDGGTYELLRNRLRQHGEELRQRLDKLNHARREVFGSIESTVKATERVMTAHNCIPRDMVPVGSHFLFGYNVHLGLKTETFVEDVFSGYAFRDGEFHEADLAIIEDPQFRRDFAQLYTYYRSTVFAKFAERGPYLYMVFQVGKTAADVKTFKWQRTDDGLLYVDNRSDHEYIYPAQHDYSWRRATRDHHREGLHPHISIEDRCFVETIGGDLTIKVEDNTESGHGVYAEAVNDPDQTLDDAEIRYTVMGNLTLLAIRPYQEGDTRYLVFNGKTEEVTRIDAIGHTCQELPDDHGLLYANGFYLQDGTRKQFESIPADMMFEARLDAANGEDFLYIFYNKISGTYVLLVYNLIEQMVATPILCHGYSLFDNGDLLLFRAEDQPQKHHAIQIWQTPFTGPNFTPEVQSNSPLYKLGNKPIVRAMAECHEILNLLNKEDAYSNLYVDLSTQASNILDGYFWIQGEETQSLGEPLGEIRAAAHAAIEEFEKVDRLKRSTRDEVGRVTSRVTDLLRSIDRDPKHDIDAFVTSLSELRAVRGEIISLKDLRYVDLEAVEAMEVDVTEHTETLSHQCVEFLIREDALAPYVEKVAEARKGVDSVAKGAEGRAAAERIDQAGSELEMLIEIVSNLKIDDPTQTTAIIDGISDIYADLNQVKSGLKNRLQELGRSEGIAEFNAQMKLLNQAVTNYLDICDTPEKCDEYANKVLVQIEDLEGRFSDFDEFIIQLTEKRETYYSAFEARKVQLLEARARRADALVQSAERILKGVEHRVAQQESVAEINGYFAADLMIDKVRNLIAELVELGEAVKSDDIATRLRTAQEDAVRQFKDRSELYGDDNTIQLGSHRFSVNTQPLQLSTVVRDGDLYAHLNGTGYFERIDDEALLATRSVWGMEVSSENADVYRAETLAWRLFHAADRPDPSDPELGKKVQAFAAPRYEEGYTKGVHDQDAAAIYRAFCGLDASLGRLRFDGPERALGLLFLRQLEALADDDSLAEEKAPVCSVDVLRAEARNFESLQKLQPASPVPRDVLEPLAIAIDVFAAPYEGLNTVDPARSAHYLLVELASEKNALSKHAAELVEHFSSLLSRKRVTKAFHADLSDVGQTTPAAWSLAGRWLEAYFAGKETEEAAAERAFKAEAAAAILLGDVKQRAVQNVDSTVELKELRGSHARINEGTLVLDYHDLTRRMHRFDTDVAPLARQYRTRRSELVEELTEDLRLDEFKPRILSSFVRNRLLNKVYLPIIGDNLAKQIGTAGESGRSDRMGLLLLISPPGYGKTTLMEYIADRLGLTFVKINGPSLGHDVVSLDPAQAVHASAREEVEKLNLAFEMGDNVMIYLDDIQHTNPEFLQKFISLCDGQRKVEGVYRGRSKTYDLRGKKVAVVMAGNPYTESGDKFQIPDMLANRADTYNLGDILGGHAEDFKLSYLENCLTSSPVLAKLARQSREDIYGFIRMAETGSQEGIDLAGNYGRDEIEEIVSTLTKLLVVRDVILKVNTQYIASAGQEEAYRTEPAFKLQGSYRNMNRITEKVLPAMNDDELQTLIFSTYENDAQTLTSGAEANLLKFRQMMGWMDDEHAARWSAITSTFQRNQNMAGIDADDKVGLLMAQLTNLAVGLERIDTAIRDHAGKSSGSDRADELAPLVAAIAAPRKTPKALLNRLDKLAKGLAAAQSATASAPSSELASTVESQLPVALTNALQGQFDAFQNWIEPLQTQQDQTNEQMRTLISYFNEMVKGYNTVLEQLRDTYLPNLEPSSVEKS